MYGKKASKKERLKRALRMSGENNPRYGKIGKENPRSIPVLKINPFTDECEKKYESIRHDGEYLNYISTNARKWYVENGTIKANVRLMCKLVDFNKLV